MSSLAPSLKSAALSCHRADSVFAVVEKCLDNGLGVCFVVDEQQRLIGRITLDDLRAAILEGTAIDDPIVERHVADRREAWTGGYASLGIEAHSEDEAVMPVLDGDGRLIDVTIDRAKGFIQVARPDLTHHEFRALLDAFMSSWISGKGPHITRFERQFADVVAVPHAAAVANGTVALHLALLALGIGPGDEVIVPDLTFAATANAVLLCGATPVIADVDSVTWTLTAEIVERAVTERTRAVIPVHLYGRPAEMGPICEVAGRRNIRVIEDCAEAHGARYAGRPVGQFGDISCFSFHANKIVSTGEGGMCLTASEALHAVVTQLRDHGAAPNRFYWHERVGSNYRMTNLQAAIGLAQVRRMEDTLARNRRIERLYREHLGSIAGVTFPPDLPDVYEPVVWLACVQVPAERRARLILEARDNGFEVRPFFNQISAMPPYEKYARPCPNSAQLSATGINLPTSRDVDEPVVRKLAALMRRVLA